MKLLDTPKEVVKTGKGEVYRFAEEDNYADSFGYEWENYSTTYTDSTLGVDLSRSRTELNLGFPLEFLEGMNVLELGCGQGRFTEHFADYAKHVVALDLSYAVYHNIALGRDNVIAVRADLLKAPKFDEPFDLVFCRGVLQHTENPKKSLQRMFDYVPVGGYVIFDVYKKGHGRWTNFKYFWRPIFLEHVKIETFNAFLEKHGSKVYAFHHGVRKVLDGLGPIGTFLQRIPLPIFLGMNWDKQYGNVDKKARLEIFKNEMVDMMYPEYDQPMSPEEVVDALAEIGQRPYSYDIYRNHFRCKKVEGNSPIDVEMTKNGVLDK